MGKFFTNERRQGLIDKYYNNKIKGVELLIDNVFDVHNVAAVSRSADGLGIRRVNLYYTYNEFPDLEKNGKNSSSSANKWIEFNRINDLDEFVKLKKKEGFVFIGADSNKFTKRLDSFKFPKKCIVILGSEGKGISPELKEVCDYFVTIPMIGMVESYNISVAAAVIMYELFKQKGKKLEVRKSGTDKKSR